MNLRVGVIADTQGWGQLLQQEGVPFSCVDLASDQLSSTCSVIVINRSLLGNERALVEKYLSGGGAVLGYAHHLMNVCGTTSRHDRIDYLVSDGEGIFAELGMMDLGIHGAIPREANQLRTQTNSFALFTGELGGGYAVILPFNVDEVVSDTRASEKNFYFSTDRLPAERVSLVAKGEVRHLIHMSLEYLHHVRELPYVHLWYFPNDSHNCFAFRIDTDGGSQKEIDELYGIAQRKGLSLSWYLDVGSHIEWLRHFWTMTNQEISLHCFDHRPHQTEEEHLADIRRGEKEMNEVGLDPEGMTAPFGMWSPEFAHACEKAGFEYSSEFALGYDTFPFFQPRESLHYTTLQIPIHPICIGSMRRVGYSERRMIDYFRMVIEQKKKRSEPLFFYHHPSHRCWEVVEFIFDECRRNGVLNMSFLEYSRWWRERLRHKLVLEADGALLDVRPESHALDHVAANVWLRISKTGGYFATIPITEQINVGAILWSKREAMYHPPEDIRRIREFQLRSTLGNLFTSIVRKLK